MAWWRKHKDDDEWFADPTKQREPDPDVQLVKLQASRTRWWRLVTWVTLLLAVYAAFTVSNTPAPATPKGVSLNETGKQAAYSITEQWLATGHPLGAQARVVSWDGATRTPTSGGAVYRHVLTVANGARWWRVAVAVNQDGTPIGYPNASPVAVPDTLTPDGTVGWSGTIKDAQGSDALSTLVTQWAQALTGSDADRLKVIMADPDPASVYQPLGLDGQFQSATVDRVAYADMGKVDKENQTSDRAFARVTISMTGRDNQPVQYGFDLLLADPDGTPRILAWGAPGDAPGLREYMNRWHGNLLDTASGTGQGSGPSPTPVDPSPAPSTN